MKKDYSLEKIKVLHTKAVLSSDGSTAFLLNLATELKDEVQFDFLLYRQEGNDWAWKFEELGSQIYYRSVKRHNSILKRFERLKLYSRFFRDHPYAVIHIDTDNVERCDVLFCAWLHKVQKRIYHSHSSGCEDEGRLIKFPVYRKFLKFLIARLATDMLACSTEAAKWMFPIRCLPDVKLIKNGIYTDRFRYNQEERLKIRAQYRLQNCYVIGCVARFVETKNHAFLIDIFEEIAKNEKSARLILVGDGKLKEDIQIKADDLHLSEKIFFVGSTNKVADFMSAMDIYVMPSLFEGLGMVFIEAQTSGLYCIASDNVPKEADINNRMKFLSLNELPRIWKEEILSAKSKDNLSFREEAWKDVVVAGYDIRDTSQQLLKIYRS